MKYSVPKYIKDPTLPLTISVIGAGGTGTMFLQYLARIVYAYQALNRRRICVVVADGDEITDANVGRQAFAPNEVGLNKAQVITSRINRFYGFDWLCKPAHFDYSQKLKKSEKEVRMMEHAANFIISAVDSVEAKRQIYQFYKKALQIKGHPEYVPHFWIDMGNTKTTGNVIVTDGKEWPTILDYQDNFEKADNEPSCSLAMALNNQDLFINPACAFVGAKWLWECLMQPEIDWRGAFINLDTFAIRKLKIKPHASEEGNNPTQHSGQPGIKRTTVKKRPAAAKKGKHKSRTASKRRVRK